MTFSRYNLQEIIFKNHLYILTIRNCKMSLKGSFINVGMSRRHDHVDDFVSQAYGHGGGGNH